MNKIATHDWMTNFGSINHQMVYQSDRYFEVATECAEPHLASASSSVIGMPGLTLENVIIHPENKLVIADRTEQACVQSVYVLSGHVDSTFDFGNQGVVMHKNRQAFQYSPGYEAEHKINTGHFHGVSIGVTPDFFKSLLTTTSGEENEIYNLFAKGEPLQSVMMLQPRMHEILHHIIHCPFRGVTRYLFIESKVLELLVLQLDQMQA